MKWDGARVYVFGEPGDDLVKVGFSSAPSVRAQHLRAAEGMPHARILYAFYCGSEAVARGIEQKTHWLLRDFRVEGEWFLVDLETAMDAIDSVAADEAPQDCIFIHPAVSRRRSEVAKAAWVRRRAKKEDLTSRAAAPLNVSRNARRDIITC